jgi:predicted dehydrogenase
MKKIRWGVLSTARIGTETVIPAMQLGEYSRVTAIASRQLEKAQAQARKLGIKKVYGSYEELLADPDIDAVYIPLPNHLHVPWAIKALNAGKHVLCEKPIGLSAVEAQKLLDAARKFPRLKVMEAFMYRNHPQWQWAKEKVSEGKIGEVRTIQSFFSYYNTDPDNIRNKADIGGGGLMDIGCYCISLSRFIFGAEPWRVCGIMEEDPNMKVDRLTSGILEFSKGTSTFTCATQLVPYQRVNIFGTKGWIEIDIPFNAPSDRPCKIWYGDGNRIEEVVLDVCNQYTIQGDLFSRAVLEDREVPVPLEDAVANMQVIEALISSARSRSWVNLKTGTATF